MFFQYNKAGVNMGDNESMFYSREQLAEYINQHEIDFVARCSTQWHMLGIRAYVLKLCDMLDRTITGVIYVGSRDGKTYAINNEMLNFPDKVSTVVFKSTGIGDAAKAHNTLVALRHKRIWNGNKTLYIISPNAGWYLFATAIDSSKYFPVTIVLEDGYAHYNDERQWLLGTYRDTKSIKRVVISAIQFSMIRLLRKRLAISEEYFTLFDKEGDMILNQDVLDYYKRSLETILPNSLNIKVPGVLFMTQPLVEDGHINVEDMESFYDNLIIFCGKELYIKVHPRDKTTPNIQSISKYIVDDHGLNAEEFYSAICVKPKLVIGFHSTSLITLNLFFGANVMSLNHTIVDRIQGKYLKESFENFERLFGKYVKVLDSFAELQQEIDQL